MKDSYSLEERMKYCKEEFVDLYARLDPRNINTGLRIENETLFFGKNGSTILMKDTGLRPFVFRETLTTDQSQLTIDTNYKRVIRNKDGAEILGTIHSVLNDERFSFIGNKLVIAKNAFIGDEETFIALALETDINGTIINDVQKIDILAMNEKQIDILNKTNNTDMIAAAVNDKVAEMDIQELQKRIVVKSIGETNRLTSIDGALTDVSIVRNSTVATEEMFIEEDGIKKYTNEVVGLEWKNEKYEQFYSKEIWNEISSEDISGITQGTWFQIIEAINTSTGVLHITVTGITFSEGPQIDLAITAGQVGINQPTTISASPQQMIATGPGAADEVTITGTYNGMTVQTATFTPNQIAGQQLNVVYVNLQ